MTPPRIATLLVASACSSTAPKVATTLAPPIRPTRSIESNGSLVPARQHVAKPSLPVSDAGPVSVPPGALQVVLTADALVVGPGPDMLIELPDSRTMATTGFGVRYKHGPNDLLVLPLDAALKQVAVDHRSSAVIYADGSTTYRVLIELLFTLSNNGCKFWILATRPEAAECEGTCGWASGPPASLGSGVVTVLLDAEAYDVRLGARPVGAACTPETAGPTIRKTPGQDHAAELASCLSSLSSQILSRAESLNADPKLLSLAADRGVTYSETIAVVDAAHHAGFEKFVLKIPR